MNRRFLLAAETYNYSYHKYADKLKIRADRFRKYMPHAIDIIEKAENKNWALEKLAEALETDLDTAEILQKQYHRALQIVDAPTPAESFRQGITQSIQHAVGEGLKNDEDIEKLAVQICYRAADLSYLLDLRNQKLSEYSEELRKEPPYLDFSDDYEDGI